MTESIVEKVREKYGDVAASQLSGLGEGVRAVAQAFGYSAEELSSIPERSNMGLSCGNPIAMASLRPGEIVVDLGSGGGLDVFLASKQVGPLGKAIGIDMTPEMITRAINNAREGGYTNVEFHHSEIDRIPLQDSCVDCIISNCVINLAPDKALVFKEMFRVLKPGGRVAVSDIALKKALPPELAQDIMAYVGCVAGAISSDEFVRGLRAVGFEAVHVMDSGADLNAYSKIDGATLCCSPAMKEEPDNAESNCCSSEQSTCCKPEQSIHEGLKSVINRYDINEFAASVKVYALKPGG